MKRENLVALWHALSGTAAMVASLFTKDAIPLGEHLCRVLGYSLFFLGVALSGWAIAHLKRSFLGNVAPMPGPLVTTGPYKYIRHPVYLGMFLSVLGIAFALLSLWGLLALLVLFVPAGIWRARLEEEALAQKFGDTWRTYVEETGFLLPSLW